MKKKTIGTVIKILSALLIVAVILALVRWTGEIKSKQRQKELKKALSDVIEVYGEKGLLEMAGVPVNDIFYGEDGITLFQGDNASWNYSADEVQNISIYEKCSPAVVHIRTTVDESVSSFLDVSTENGVGSGFFVTEDGYICTNIHVIEGASEITVTTADSKQYVASIIGKDEENDIAVIKINPVNREKFTYLEFDNSDNLVVGQRVLAIGNPFGYSRTMVSGMVSGLSRPIRDGKGQVLLGMIQTDAPINPGNSGGPMLNTKGKVVGVSTSIYSKSGVSEGMNFAVASNTANASVSDIIKYGKVNRGWIDIVPVQLTKQIIDYSKLNVESGILVSQVAPNGCAYKAGIRGGDKKVLYGSSQIYIGGDIITDINGFTISDISDLFTALTNTRPGDKVAVTVNRNGEEIDMKVELVERTSENIGWINR